MHLLDREVGVLRYDGTSKDEYGNDRPDWVPDGTLPGRLRRLSAQEVLSAGERTFADWVLYMAGDVVLAAEDRVQIDGQVFELAGDPYYVRRVGTVSHLEARLRAYGG